MERFHRIDDAEAIVHHKGVFRQSPLFRRGAELFVKHGSGFVRLYSGGGTGIPAMTWKDIDPGSGAYSEKQYNLTYIAPVATITVAAE